MPARGYELGEMIYESKTSVLYRGIASQDFRPVILKMCNKEYCGMEKNAQIRYEYEMLKYLDGDGVIKVYELLEESGSGIIVFEDFDAEALNGIDFSHWSLEDKIELCIKIVECVVRIHARDVIHKDLNPANIVLNRQNGEVKIIDFGSATRLKREKTSATARFAIEGTLAYMAPEQTGRMNRLVDYRVDTYALGATFYELFSNQTLYPQAKDSVELMHCILAKEPKNLTEIDAAIPETIARIIMKMLAKKAEERYQSLKRLCFDLSSCLEQLRLKGRVEEFVIGQKDGNREFRIPQHLYGRKKELGEIVASYENTYRGAFETVIVSGASGVGKSMLVSELQKLVLKGSGHFVVGKCEQQRSNVPYGPLLDACRELVRMVLAEPDERLVRLKERLNIRIGSNGRIISDVVPEAVFLFGEQAAVSELSPSENQNRFNFVFREFIMSFVDYQQTLVIFLDDLQWVDVATLNLLQTIVMAKEQQYLCLIGAYRTDAVEAFHPLAVMLAEWEKRRIRVKKIEIKPLSEAAIVELLADCFACSAAKCGELAALIRLKTDGIPFFINETLNFLEQQKLIRLDEGEDCWKWDLKAIQESGLATSMGDLLAKRIAELDANTQRVLGMASLVGNRFDFNILAELEPLAQHQTAAALWIALKEGFIQPLDPSYKYINDSKVNPVFHFFHDSVQQAAQLSLTEDEKLELHLRIGRILREQEKTIGGESRIFEIVAHLNAARSLLEEESEIRELGALNYWAAKKAKRSSAFTLALEYFRKALSCLGKNAWKKNPALAHELHVQSAAVAYSCAEYEAMEDYCRIVFEHCQDCVERSFVYEIRIRALLAKGQVEAAVRLALEALATLGVDFPERITKSYLMLQMMETRLLIYLQGLHSLASLPRLNDRKKEAVMRLLATVSSSAYLAAPELFLLMALKQLEITLKYGTSSHSPFACCMYGLVIGGLSGDLEKGYKLAKIGLAALENGEYHEAAGKTRVVGNLFVAHWKDSLGEVIAEFMRAYRSAMETGDVEYAAWALFFHGFHSFCAGTYLPSVENDLAAAAEKMKNELCQEMQLRYTFSFIHLVRKLRGKASETEASFEPELPDEEALLQTYHKNKDYNGLYYSYSNRMMEAVFFGKYDDALEAARLTRPYRERIDTTISQAEFIFYSLLAAYGASDKLYEEERAAMPGQIGRFKKLAKAAPQTHAHKFRLLEAEEARRCRLNDEAAAAFDEAIKVAQENGFLQDAALANERAGEFYDALGKDTIARSYRMEAYHLYFRWGAKAKTKSLRDKYLYLWMKSEDIKDLAAGSLRLTAPQVFDWFSIVKIAQILSSEMNYERLLENMMRIVMENAGAQRGVFLIRSGVELIVEAKADMSGDDYKFILPQLELEACRENDFSWSIVNYVLRTEEGVILPNAASDKVFGNDDYVKQNQAQSVLCMPVLTHKTVIGVLYLENNLVKGAFTPERFEILQVVASQAAISLENIRLYRSLEEKVNERTAQLNERTSELERAYAEMKHISMHDALTGLYNRGYFEQEMNRLGKRRNTVIGLIICDLDGLKRVNDQQGHEAGDKMIRAAGEVLKNTFRECDMVARIGGDEFAILAPDVDMERMLLMKERIELAVQQYNKRAGKHDLSISVGVALKERGDSTMLDVFREADARMYQDKQIKPALQRR